MKLNVYSCGCTAMDVSVVSTCDEHGGYVVSATDDVIGRSDRRSFMTKDKSSILLYADVLGAMRKLKDSSVGLVLSYPDHFFFYVRSLTNDKAFRDFPDSYFTECRRILARDGHIVLVVEPAIITSVVFCAAMSGFQIANQFLIRMRIVDHVETDKDSIGDNGYRAVLFFSRTGQDIEHEVRTVKDVRSAALSLHKSGLILDTSCIHHPFVVSARKKAKTIGIVSGRRRYEALKSRLAKLCNNKSKETP